MKAWIIGVDRRRCARIGAAVLCRRLGEIGKANLSMDLILVPAARDNERYAQELVFTLQALEIPSGTLRVRSCDSSSVDHYVNKISMIEAATAIGIEDLVYLDYDHLCARCPAVFARRDTVGVSSETRLLSDLEARFLRNARVDRHVNTSIIGANREVLAQVAGHWRQAYVDLAPFIGVRFREEYAFGLACQRAGVPCEGVDATVQSNWSTSVDDWSLFHFGGEYPWARESRAILEGSAENDDRSPAVILALAEQRNSLRCDPRFARLSEFFDGGDPSPRHAHARSRRA